MQHCLPDCIRADAFLFTISLVRPSSTAATVPPMQTNYSSKMIDGHAGGKGGPLLRKDAQHVSGGAVERAEACKDIRCDYDATCELGADSFPRCSCVFDCLSPAWHNAGPQGPVCASNQRMFPSLCDMKREGCQRQEELRLRPMDLCKGECLLPPSTPTLLCGQLSGARLSVCPKAWR